MSRQRSLPTADASRALSTSASAPNTAVSRSASGASAYLSAMDSHVSSAALGAGVYRPTTSSRTARIPIYVSTSTTGEHCASRVIGPRRLLAGAATGSMFEASEIAAKRLSQEVMDFGASDT